MGPGNRGKRWVPEEGRGIRTPDAVPCMTVFKTAAFNHSAIPPQSEHFSVETRDTESSDRFYGFGYEFESRNTVENVAFGVRATGDQKRVKRSRRVSGL